MADGFATCPFTQVGLVRILSNPAVVPGAVSATVAARLLDRIMALPGHQFWPDDILVSKAVLAYPGLTGHKQVMDAYLVEQTRKHGGGFATLDHGVSRLSRPEEPGLIEVVAPR